MEMSEKTQTEKRDSQEEELDASQTKKPFTEPKFTFIEPKLTKHGDVTKVTTADQGNGFFGNFST